MLFRPSFLAAATTTLSVSVTALVHRVQKSSQQRRFLDPCPAPAPCSCQCDCPETVTKPPPPAPEGCPETLPVKFAATGENDDIRCGKGFVRRSDNLCHEITPDIIKKLRNDVLLRRSALDSAQEKFDTTNTPDAAETASEKKELRRELLKQHEAYSKALDMLLGAWDQASFNPKNSPKNKSGGKVEDGEFVAVKTLKRGRAHCEEWMTRNSTYMAGAEDCGVLCRNEPMCVGFGLSVAGRYCVWFDAEVVPADEEEGGRRIDFREGSFRV